MQCPFATQGHMFLHAVHRQKILAKRYKKWKDTTIICGNNFYKIKHPATEVVTAKTFIFPTLTKTFPIKPSLSSTASKTVTKKTDVLCMKTIIVKNNLENMITTNEQSPLITPMPSLYGPPNVTRTNAKLPRLPLYLFFSNGRRSSSFFSQLQKPW